MLYITIVDENDNWNEFWINNGNDKVDRENITEYIDRINFG